MNPKYVRRRGELRVLRGNLMAGSLSEKLSVRPVNATAIERRGGRGELKESYLRRL
jgi:hypothetical protein